MSIRKFRAARVTTTNASTYVGQYGDMFYDESTGTLHVSDGHTPGGHIANLAIASTTQVGGIKAGAGANVSVDGTLTINTAGLPLSVGDLSISLANISTANANEDLNLLTNGTGNVNIVGNLRLYTTSAGQFQFGQTPLLSVSNQGNVTINGNTITNGTSTFNGSTLIVGPTTHTGNLVTNGNLITNGSSYFNGPEFNVGNVNITGNLINNGTTYNNGPLYQNGNAITTGTLLTYGNTVTNGNLLTYGNTITNGNLIVNGLTTTNGDSTFIGNITANGNVTVNGITTFNGNTIRNGNIVTTGNVTYNGSLTNNGPTYNNGPQYQNGNLYVTGNTTITVTLTSSNYGGVEITANAQGLFQPPQNGGVTLHTTGPDTGSMAGRAYFDSVNNYTVVAGRRYNGTIANPTQVLANQDIIRWGGTPYATGGWPSIGPVRMSYVASENMTATNQGGRIEFYATANGSVASTSIARVATVDPAIGLTSDLGITAVGAVTTQDGITGNSITANTQVVSSGGIVKVAGGTPSVTLNFNTTSMVLIYQPTGTVTFSLGTLVAGSEITCLVNMGATGHNVATGVSATNNSTTGTTTLATTQGGGGNLNNQAVKLVYTCVDGTAANTYVAINYV